MVRGCWGGGRFNRRDEYWHREGVLLLKRTRLLTRSSQEGKFERFGLSNFTAQEVEEVCAICDREGLVRPTAYQCKYSIIARDSEEELFPVLRREGISFYAYRCVGSLPVPQSSDLLSSFFIPDGLRSLSLSWMESAYPARVCESRTMLFKGR